MIDLGIIIEQKFNESGLQISFFAEKINTSTRNVYNIFKRKSLDTDLLYKICEVLKTDFFAYYSAQLQNIDIDTLQKNTLTSQEKKKKVLVELELSDKEYADLLSKV